VRFQHAENLLDNRSRVGAVVDDAEGVDVVEVAGGKRQATRVGRLEAAHEAARCEIPTRQLDSGVRQIDARIFRSPSCELSAVRAEPTADLEDTLAGEGVELRRCRDELRVRIAIALDAQEVLQRVLGARRFLAAGMILPELADLFD
jgi:hypothetical protein